MQIIGSINFFDSFDTDDRGRRRGQGSIQGIPEGRQSEIDAELCMMRILHAGIQEGAPIVPAMCRQGINARQHQPYHEHRRRHACDGRANEDGDEVHANHFDGMAIHGDQRNGLRERMMLQMQTVQPRHHMKQSM